MDKRRRSRGDPRQQQLTTALDSLTSQLRTIDQGITRLQGTIADIGAQPHRNEDSQRRSGAKTDSG